MLSELPFREIEVLRSVDEHLTANYQLLDFDGNKRQFNLKISYALRD